MDFFGIGAAELILVLIVALIVMGPGKLVQISRELGKLVHTFRKASSDLSTQISRELEIEEKEPSPETKEKAKTEKPTT